MKKTKIIAPSKGIKGLFENWKSDAVSGFFVFILALPLSLGIAKASGFPPAMGVLSAMIGGLVTSFFNVSALVIKGPAAGLITVCAGAVAEFGGEITGWKIAAGVIVVAALIQIIFGFLKFGALSDFFPHSAIHGMLAAIGLIIIAKQIPVLLGDDPTMYKGEGPLELFMDIPRFVMASHWHIALVGIIGLIVLFVFPLFKISILKKLPLPFFVLLLTIPMALIWHFKQTEPSYSLVTIGDFWGSISMNADFSVIGTFAFWKYVFMFLFVGSLESLLTVKATDNMDPYKRVSSYNGDLIGQGVGNVFSGLMGGLPMISEVVRSSANVGFNAKTKWSNFFHGIFLLIAMLLMIPMIEMIPNSALAAMLIFAGYRLAAPKEFIHTYKIGKEQLAIFLTTVVITLAEDLLLGVAAGIIVKFLFHLYNGAKVSSLFKANYRLQTIDHKTILHIEQSAIFSNLIGFKKALFDLPEAAHVIIDLSEAQIIDHSFMVFLHHFELEYNAHGGNLEINGLDKFRALSKHPMATRVKKHKRVKIAVK